MLKSVAKRINKEEGAKVISTAFMINSMDMAIGKMENDLDKYKMRLGLFYFDSYTPREDLKDTLKLAESLCYPYYNYLIRLNSKSSLMDEEIELLFGSLQIRLANSLISGKSYDYKSILNDFIDFAGKYYTVYSLSAKILAKVALNQDVKIPSYVNFVVPIAMAINGKNVNEFLRVAELFEINSKDISELLNTPALAEAKVVYSLLKGENVDNYISYLDKNGTGPMFRIAHKFLKENDKSRYIASLILFL